jgi:hypothetical protein
MAGNPHNRTCTPQEAARQAGAAGRVEQRSLAAAVSSLLGGVRGVTISAPGVLLQEWTPAELQARAILIHRGGALRCIDTRGGWV